MRSSLVSEQKACRERSSGSAGDGSCLRRNRESAFFLLLGRVLDCEMLLLQMQRRFL